MLIYRVTLLSFIYLICTCFPYIIHVRIHCIMNMFSLVQLEKPLTKDDLVDGKAALKHYKFFSMVCDWFQLHVMSAKHSCLPIFSPYCKDAKLIAIFVTEHYLRGYKMLIL